MNREVCKKCVNNWIDEDDVLWDKWGVVACPIETDDTNDMLKIKNYSSLLVQNIYKNPPESCKYKLEHTVMTNAE